MNQLRGDVLALLARIVNNKPRHPLAPLRQMLDLGSDPHFL